MSIKDFLKRILIEEDENNTKDNSDIKEIINCPNCNSTETFIKWIYTVRGIDRETICPNCGLIKNEPWMNIRRTPDGINSFHQKNGLTYIEIEYKNKMKELVVPLKGNYDNEAESKIEIHKKDCLLFKNDPIYNDNFIIIVKGIYDNKISNYMLLNCKSYSENFYKCATSCIYELGNEMFETIKDNTDYFSSVAVDFHNSISNTNEKMPKTFKLNENIETTITKNPDTSNITKMEPEPVEIIKELEIIETIKSSKTNKNIDVSEVIKEPETYKTPKLNKVIETHEPFEPLELFIVNEECTPCPSCESHNTFIVYEETTSTINKTIICPKCGYRKNISSAGLNRDMLNLKKFQEKFGDIHIRIEYRDGTIKELPFINKKIADIMFLPKQKCVLMRNISETRIITIIKGAYKNKTSYYLLTNCYDAGIYDGIILCEKRYCQQLKDDEIEQIKYNPDIIEKIADKYYNFINKDN